MKRFLFALLLVMASAFAASAGALQKTEGSMAYCTVNDLCQAYGEDRISGWSRLDPDTVDRAIVDASAEIDGYLLSGGYAVPLAGTPATLKKYCIDIACSNLVLSAGVLDTDPGGKAVYEQAKVARHYLEKVAEGKFKIPGYSNDGDAEATASDSAGNVRVWSRHRLDLRGY